MTEDHSHLSSIIRLSDAGLYRYEHVWAAVERESFFTARGAVYGGGCTVPGDMTAPLRYVLWCEEALPSPASKTLAFIMLNPSTATHLKDDPTIRRCRSFAAQWGFTKLFIGNAYAFRATKPRDMKAADDPVGPLNDVWLELIASESAQVVVAWGKHATEERTDAIRRTLERVAPPKGVWCLRRNADGSPEHPLYVPKNVSPQPWP